MSTTTVHYQAPGWFTRRVFNPFVAWCTRRGLSMWGARELEVRGRTSGVWRRVPVNLLEVDGDTFLVAPRGETQWVRNVRAADGHLRLRSGRQVTEHVAAEMTGDAAVPVLRAYLERWSWEVGVFFDGVGPESSDDELRAAAERHPTFRLSSS